MVEEKIIKSEIFVSQNKIWDQLKKITVSNRVGGAYLFFGPSGCGKEYIATQFAQMLNCEDISGEICRDCSSCKRAKNLQHENINLVFPLPAIKKGSNNKDNEIENSNLDIVTDSIKKKSRNPFYKIQIPKANRILIQSIRQLRKTLYLKTHNVGRKIVLVFDAHLLNAGQGESGNAFLKILEEPPVNTTIILVTDYMELLLPTILSRCQKINFPKLNNKYLQKWCLANSVKESNIPLVIGLSECNIHNATFLISQSLEEIISSISSVTKAITQNNPEKWRSFISKYSQLAKRDKAEFCFHFNMLKIWFQATNRLTKSLNHILHKTSFINDMKIFIKNNPQANFSSIIFELEKPMLALGRNFHMPLVLINLLLELQKSFRR